MRGRLGEQSLYCRRRKQEVGMHVLLQLVLCLLLLVLALLVLLVSLVLMLYC